MIHLERTPPPAFLLSDKVKLEKQRLRDFYSDPKNSQNRVDFNASIYLHKDVKAELLKITNWKCAYCENDIGAGSPIAVEHYRPKSIYWWLAYEWDNLIPACQICNLNKKNVFPVENPHNINDLLGKKTYDLDEFEKPLLLNPFIDYPKEHFDYSVKGVLTSLSIRGKITIDTLKLNRNLLIIKRREVYQSYQFLKSNLDFIQDEKRKYETLDRLSRMVEGPFTGLVQKMLLSTVTPIEPNSLEKFLDTKRYPKKEIVNRFYSCKIEINNFKSINNLNCTLRNFEENNNDKSKSKEYRESWLLILGENGVGKSSVLQAIILTLLPKDLRVKYWDSNILKKGEKEGKININFDDGVKIEMPFDNKGVVSSNLGQYNDYLIAYGATRLLPRGNLQPETNDSKIKVHNFFDYSVALQNAEAWLLELPEKVNEDNIEEIKKGTFDKAALFLKDLLFLEGKENLSRKDGKIFVFKNNNNIELGMLSDGYKTLFALAMDLYITFRMQQTDIRYEDVSQFATGLVLIDEIGTHLHPRWKMKIVEQLRTALPNVFFIVTTHDPLCLRGLRDKEVMVLKRDTESQNIFSVENLPSPEGLRVDQILTSKYFGLNTTIDPEAEEKFNRYYELLAKNEDSRTAKEKKEIESLQKRLKVLKQLGDNLREELFYFVIDEVLAKYRKERITAKKEKLKDEVRNKIIELSDIIDSELNI